MFDKSFCIVDVETTGSRASHDRIIEIGIIRVEGGTVTKTLETLVNPEAYVSPFIENFTGIRSEDLTDAPLFYDIAPQVHELLADAILVAHNARFDYGFLKHELKTAGLSYQSKILCTARLSRRLYPKYRRHNLTELIDRFGFECARRHRAYDDAHVLWQFLQLVDRDFPPNHVNACIAELTGAHYTQDPLVHKQVEELPESDGVYLFYDKENVPLYIGKSNNIKDRVISHFTSDYESSRKYDLIKGIKRIDHIKTAGELGALLLESRLIKDMLPIYNRQLRRKKKLVALVKDVTSDRYETLKLKIIDAIDPAYFENILGIFRSKKSAHETLADMADRYGLCNKLLGLEKTSGTCFNYKLGKCHGACAGRISAQKYNLRFMIAYHENRQFRPWPFDGPIEVKEKNEDEELYERFFIDRWCLLSRAGEDHVFDVDTYHILSRYLQQKVVRHPHIESGRNIKLKSTEEEYQTL